MRPLTVPARLDAPLERLAQLSVAGYAALFAVSALKWKSDPDSPITFGMEVGRALWGDRVDNARLAPVNNFLFVALGLVPVTVAFVLALSAALRGHTRARRVSLATVLGFTAAYCVPLIFLPRMLSSDVFSYICYGRMSALHGVNPLIYGPAAHPDLCVTRIGFEPFRFVPSAYGPVWMLVSHGVTLVAEAAGGTAQAYVLCYKLLAAGAHLASAATIWSILGRTHPAQQLAGTVAYAWNPLMLAESAWNAHNDVLMLLLVLLALAAYTRRRPALGLVPLALSIPLKWASAPAYALYALVIAREDVAWRTRGLRALAAVVVVAGVFVATYKPYWQGVDTLEGVRHAPSNHFTTNSLGDLALVELRRARFQRAHGRPPEDLVRISLERTLQTWPVTHRLDWSRLPARDLEGLERAIRGLTALILVAVWGFWALRARDAEGLALGFAWTFFAYVTAAAVWVWPWYVTWVLGVAVLPAWGRAGRTGVVLSLSAAMLYFSSLLGDPGYRTRALFAFVPPLAYLAWDVLRARRTRAGAAAPEEAAAPDAANG